MATQLFEPFQDRLSRDIRNDLSEALLPALNQKTLAPVRAVAQGYLQKGLAAPYVAYIETRLEKYAAALETLARIGREDALTRGLVLWDLELFFEVHEVLEHAWLAAKGAEKEILQALIRAAGFYIKGEFGYVTGGAKMAARAVTALEKNRQACTGFDLDILLQSLRNLDPVPPKLFRQDIAH